MESDSQQALVDSQFNETPAQILLDESDVVRMKQVMPTTTHVANQH